MRSFIKKIKIFIKPIYLWFLRIRNFFRRIIDIIGLPFIRRKFSFVQDQMASNQNMSALETEAFNKAYLRGVKATGHDINIKLRIHQAIWCSLSALNVEGDFVELGTGKGFTFSAVMEYLSIYGYQNNKNVFLFDTFLPVKPDRISGKQVVPKYYKIATAYADGVHEVQDNFREWPNVKLITGNLPESAENYLLSKPKISFLHVDLNHYSAEIASLDKFYNFISDGGIILLDDYANIGRNQQWHAYTKFFTNKDLHILTTASGQGIVIKRISGQKV